MATCNESINAAIAAGIGTVPEIFPNTITPFSVTGLANQLFRIETPIPQTINFSTTITSSPPNVIFTLFRIDGLSFTSIGSVTISDINSGFTFDISAGTFVICVRRGAFVNQTGSFIASFTGFPVAHNLSPRAHTGERMEAVLTIPRPPVECNEALFFEIVEGELPPGLQMDSTGTIYGQLPNLDCLSDAPSPAVGWYYKEDGAAHPVGRVWRFKVRLSVAGSPSTPTEGWFCVRIHNNWDFDRDNFQSHTPFEYLAEYREEVPTEKLSGICAPCVEPDVNSNIFRPKALPKTEEPAPVRFDLIELPKDLCKIATNEIVEWYIANRDQLTGSPEVDAFMARLKESFAFQILLSKAGYSKEENEHEFAIVNRIEDALQISIIQPTDTSAADPASWAGKVAQWRLIQNQALPTGMIFRGGETATAELTKFDKP